ncbi:MAG TPA: DUF2911 domain-containing protein [Gemmatimonadaceae bacterium]|nr:DUF2911 domain-containing protein [Gemmatimonadaceae bacterium]
MSRLRSNRAVATVLLGLAPLAGCSSSSTSYPLPAAPAGATTLLVRLGDDTLGFEQYTRSATRMQGVLVQRVPFTTVANYDLQLGAGEIPVHADYTLRRGDGTPIRGSTQSLSVTFGTDSVTFRAHRANGDTARTAAMHGTFLPYLNGSYGLFELALARLRAAGRDSMEFAIVPLNFNVQGTTPLPVTITSSDAARINWFGDPLFARFDGRGHIIGMDGSQTTDKVRVDRVSAVNMDSLGHAWAARDSIAGPVGQVSTRDTAHATIGSAHVWVDYGRPSLRGRNVWVNGVLGDTLWRTGANAATQLGTDADLVIGGATIPAGTYSLWTATTGGYQLVVNRQHGQWGTDHDPAQDMVRIPLRETSLPSPVERFTIGFTPEAGSTLLALSWGSKRLSVPITPK